jgi:ABC-type nitrate/sulfonate/bicarbonate transport system substrate-binding protein
VSARAPRRLKVIYFRAAYNLPITLGLEHGVFARHGLDLEITYTLGSRMSCAALVSGAQDLGALALDDVVDAVEKRNADLFAFMGYNSGTIELMARPGIQSARDLTGRTLGVDDPASGFAFVAHKILQGMGLRRDAYETVPSGGHHHRAQALKEGKIDAAMIAPPFSVELTTLGFITLGCPLDHLPRYQGSVGVTTRRWAATNSATLVTYIRAYRESLQWTLDPSQPRRRHRAPRTRFRPASGHRRAHLRRAHGSPRGPVPRRRHRRAGHPDRAGLARGKRPAHSPHPTSLEVL